MNTAIADCAAAVCLVLAPCAAVRCSCPSPRAASAAGSASAAKHPGAVGDAPVQFRSRYDDVIGELQVTKVEGEDTLSDIARRFNVGYEELLRANPGVDPWLPGVGREIVVPTQFVLPAAPREGLVINLAQLRVFYFPR